MSEFGYFERSAADQEAISNEIAWLNQEALHVIAGTGVDPERRAVYLQRKKALERRLGWVEPPGIASPPTPSGSAPMRRTA